MRWIIPVFILLICFSGVSRADSASGIVDIYRLDYSGAVDSNRGGTSTACWTLSGAVGATISEPCGSHSFTVNGAPTRVQYAGIWPNADGIAGTQGEAWYFNGANAYLTIAAASATDFDPAGSFSVGVIFTKSNTGGGEYIWSKFAGSGGWLLWTDAGGRVEWFLDDGPTTLFVDTGTAAKINTPICAVGTYEQTNPAEIMLYVDEIAAKSNTRVGFGPLPGNSQKLGLGALGNGANKLEGVIYRADFWDGVVLTEAQARAYCRQWRGLISASTNSVTITSASPPAIMLAPPGSGAEPFFYDQPTNSSQIGSTTSSRGGIYGGGPLTSLANRGSLETWAAGSPSGWTETSGGGTSDATQNTTSMAKGASSAAMACDGVNNLTLDTACKSLANSTSYYGLVYAKTTAGTANFTLQLLEYTDGSCTVGLTTTNLWGAGDPGANWIRAGGTRTTGAGVNSGRLRLLIDTNAATVLADGAMLYEGDQPTDLLCTSDADASVTCTLNDVTVDPGVGLITAGEWQFNATISSPIDGAVASPVRQILRVPGTAGNNNRVDLSWASDVLTCTIFDSGGVARTSTVAAAGNADTNFDVMMSHTSDGRVECCWDGTCDATPATSAVMDGVGSEIVYGSDGTTGGEIWIQEGVWSRRYNP